jgi:hypothetical protein
MRQWNGSKEMTKGSSLYQIAVQVDSADVVQSGLHLESRNVTTEMKKPTSVLRLYLNSRTLTNDPLPLAMATRGCGKPLLLLLVRWSVPSSEIGNDNDGVVVGCWSMLATSM